MSQSWGKKKPAFKKEKDTTGGWGADITVEKEERGETLGTKPRVYREDPQSDNESYEPESDDDFTLPKPTESMKEDKKRRVARELGVKTDTGYLLYQESQMNAAELELAKTDPEAANKAHHRRLFYQPNPFPSFTGKPDEHGIKRPEMGILSQSSSPVGKLLGFENYHRILKGITSVEAYEHFKELKGRMTSTPLPGMPLNPHYTTFKHQGAPPLGGYVNIHAMKGHTTREITEAEIEARLADYWKKFRKSQGAKEIGDKPISILVPRRKGALEGGGGR
jgi:hypothetical protein